MRKEKHNGLTKFTLDVMVNDEEGYKKTVEVFGGQSGVMLNVAEDVEICDEDEWGDPGYEGSELFLTPDQAQDLAKALMQSAGTVSRKKAKQ